MNLRAGMKTISEGRLLIARWPQPVEVEDIETLLRDLRDAHAQAGTRLVYVMLIPEESEPVPPRPIRQLMRRSAAELMSHCEVVHVVIQGSGVLPTLSRSAVKAFAVAAGHTGNVHIWKSVLEAAAEIRRRHGIEEETVLRAVREIEETR